MQPNLGDEILTGSGKLHAHHAPETDPTFHIVLYQPEIPPNTGTILRLCAATGTVPHLVGPLGFRLDDAALRRAGMDYRDLVRPQRYVDWEAYVASHPLRSRLIACSTQATTRYDSLKYQPGDRFLFGPETRGLPLEILASCAPWCVRIPMQEKSRSLNLAISVGIVLYEALRQLRFPELT